jgi:hypothetical protein
MVPSRQRLLTGLASAVLIPLAIFACNGIIGLDEYDRVECTGRVCDGGNPFDGPAVDAPGVDANTFDGGQGTDPVSWARWPMPNYHLDGAAEQLGNQPNLTVNGPEVTDNTTSLVWRASMEKNGVLDTFEAAQQACRELTGGDWRLPKRIELITLLDYGHVGPFYNATKFTGFKPVRGWTSSEVRPVVATAPKYWVVHFDTGAVEQALGTDSVAAAVCVKAK